MTHLASTPIINPAINLEVSNSGVIVDGLVNIELLRGIGAETVLPLLIPYLKSGLTVDEIIEKNPGIPEQDINSVLEALASWGLIQEQCENSMSLTPSDRFLVRHQMSTRNECNLELARSRFQHVQVHIEARESALDKFKKTIEPLLCGSFLERVTYRNLAGYDDVPAIIMRVTIDFSDCEAVPADNPHSKVTLFLIEAPDTLYVCSANCVNAAGASCWENYYRDILRACGPQNGTGHPLLVASVLVGEVVDIVMGSPHALVGRAAREYAFSGFKSVFRCYPRSPLCEGCSESGDASHNQAETWDSEQSTRYSIVWHYNEQLHRRSSLESTESTWPSSMPLSGQKSTVSRYVGASIPLPASGVSFRSASLSALVLAKGTTRTNRLTSTQIAALCSLSAGIRAHSTSGVKRWAPSGGNLGSTELHLLVSEVDGLQPGVYTYDPVQHALYSREKHHRRAANDIYAALAKCNHLRAASALAIYSTRQDALRPKYGPFSYKLGFLDGGCALAQARFVAAAMQLRNGVIESWPDELLSEIIGLRRAVEQVTGILALNPRTSFLRNPVPLWFVSSSGVLDFDALRSMALDEMVSVVAHEAETSDEVVRCRKASRRGPRVLGNGATIDLPAGGRDVIVDVDDVLIHRASTRRFDSSSVTLSELGTILSAGALSDTASWQKGQALEIDLNYFVICSRVYAVPHGLYRYIPSRKKLSRVSLLSQDFDTSELYVQQECASAAVTVIITGDIAEATSRVNTFGYRHLLVRAGSAGQTMALAALAQGLSSAVLAGITSETAYRIMGIRDTSQSTLFACVVGRQLQKDQSAWGKRRAG